MCLCVLSNNFVFCKRGIHFICLFGDFDLRKVGLQMFVKDVHTRLLLCCKSIVLYEMDEIFKIYDSCKMFGNFVLVNLVNNAFISDFRMRWWGFF